MPNPAGAETKRPNFITNVLWSWSITGVGFFLGFFLTPYIIRKLGPDRYGIWAQMFSLLDYLWFFDLGFNAAISNFCARFRVNNESDKINQVVNTALFYFSGVACVLVTLAIVASQNIEHLFNVPPDHRDEFAKLMLITGVAWGAFPVVHIFTSCLDGFQRFDLTSRAWTIMMLIRSFGWVILVWQGYGLVEMGILAVFAQAVGYTINVVSFARVFPALRISPSFISREMIGEMTHYGIPSFLINASMLVLNQAPLTFIGHYRSMTESGYFAVPSRLLQTAVDAVSRVGIVTRSAVAEREASGNEASVLQLGIYSNRYCFLLFVPLTLFLLIFGREFINVWTGALYANYSYPVVRILVPAIALVMAGQYNSSAILFGLRAHKRYAHGLMAEAALMLIGLLLVVPTYGIVGAAWLVASLMIGVRGIYTPWLVTRYFQSSFLGYLSAIYLRPILTALPVAALLLLLKQNVLPGRNWFEVIAAGAVTAGTFFLLAIFTCLHDDHRNKLSAAVGRKWKAMLPGGAHA